MADSLDALTAQASLFALAGGATPEDAPEIGRRFVRAFTTPPKRDTTDLPPLTVAAVRGLGQMTDDEIREQVGPHALITPTAATQTAARVRALAPGTLLLRYVKPDAVDEGTALHTRAVAAGCLMRNAVGALVRGRVFPFLQVDITHPAWLDIIVEEVRSILEKAPAYQGVFFDHYSDPSWRAPGSRFELHAWQAALRRIAVATRQATGLPVWGNALRHRPPEDGAVFLDVLDGLWCESAVAQNTGAPRPPEQLERALRLARAAQALGRRVVWDDSPVPASRLTASHAAYLLVRERDLCLWEGPAGAAPPPDLGLPLGAPVEGPVWTRAYERGRVELDVETLEAVVEVARADP